MKLLPLSLNLLQEIWVVFFHSQVFWKGLRKICDEENIVFIFDEVMTGFRLAQGGAQEKLNINADLVTYGKVIGGRIAGWCIWRKERNHATHCTAWKCLPGRNIKW